MQERQPVGRGRPRRVETDDKITSATMALLREQGPEAVSVASVAERSGLARTTIYRRFRNREELLRAALQPVTAQGTPPAESSVRAKFVWVLTRTQDVLAGSIGLGGVAALVGERDPAFSSALRSSLHSALEPIVQQVTDDVERGVLASHVDADIVINLVLGAYLAEVLRYGRPRADWLPRTADLMAASLSTSSHAE